MKTFTDIVEKKMSSFFTEVREHPELASFITNGFPNAIASYLASDMYENSKPESELVLGSPTGKLMRFGLKSTKKGDSVAFIPEFDMLDAGKEYINSDEVKFDSDTIEDFAKEIIKNTKFAKCLREAFAGKLYHDGEWIDIITGDDKGLVFDDEQDAAVCAESVVLSLIEILCNNKDSTTDLTFEIPKLGIFKVSSVKDGYNVSLTFDKEFKSNCKSDKLAEKIADSISE